MAKKLLDSPKRMGEKIREIRRKLDVTQQQMYELLLTQNAKIHPGYIGLYETDERLPSHMVTLAYARVAGISTDILIDDNLELPVKLHAHKINF